MQVVAHCAIAFANTDANVLMYSPERGEVPQGVTVGDLPFFWHARAGRIGVYGRFRRLFAESFRAVGIGRIAKMWPP